MKTPTKRFYWLSASDKEECDRLLAARDAEHQKHMDVFIEENNRLRKMLETRDASMTKTIKCACCKKEFDPALRSKTKPKTKFCSYACCQNYHNSKNKVRKTSLMPVMQDRKRQNWSSFNIRLII